MYLGINKINVSVWPELRYHVKLNFNEKQKDLIHNFTRLGSLRTRLLKFFGSNHTFLSHCEFLFPKWAV